MSEFKNILIEGTTNRYQIKKAMKIIQTPKFIKTPTTIFSKINNYKQQDNKRNIFDSEKFITPEYISKLMEECQMNCYYCKEKMLLTYDLVREMNQWTLDRIDNDKGHNIDNVIIACLSCNLKRRRRKMKDYYDIKNMNVIRLDGENSIDEIQ
jgi:hypothetical protein